MAAKTKAKTKPVAKPKAKTAPAKTAPKTKTAALKSPAAVKRETPSANIVPLRLDQLVSSPLNPRTSFPADEIADLSASIAADGLLQNLVVRPLEPGGIGTGQLKIVRSGLPVYEVIAGGRRLRALHALEEEGKWDRTAANIPCNIQPRGDGQAIALAIIENLKRIDVPPLEEAEGFRKLRDLDAITWSTEKIGTAIGRTQRYVQQRIALVERLDPKVQDALRKGKIDVTHARALVLAPAADQRAELKSIENYGADPARLTERMLKKLPKLKLAFFPRTQYTGDVAEGRDYNGRTVQYAVDKPQFDQLQKAAIAAKRQALATKWAWVKIEKDAYAWRIGERYSPTKDPKKAGALIIIDREGNVSVRTGVCEKAQEKSRDVAAENRKYKERRAAITAAEIHFYGAIADAVTAKPAFAMAIVLTAMLTDIELLDPGYGEKVSTVRSLPWREHFGDLARRPNRVHQEAGLAIVSAPDNRRLLERIEALSDPNGLLAALVTESIGSWHHNRITPIVAAIASRLAIVIPPILKDEEDGGDFMGDEVEDKQRCRMCGCTDYDDCHGETHGDRCTWVEPALCSACAPEKAAKPAKASPRKKGEREPIAAPGDMVGVGKLAEDSLAETEPVS